MAVPTRDFCTNIDSILVPILVQSWFRYWFNLGTNIGSILVPILVQSWYRSRLSALIQILRASQIYFLNLHRRLFWKKLNSLDKLLWTYSKKHFIPHATINDPRPIDQAILITTKLKNLNNAKIILFINPSKQIILESISKYSGIVSNKIKKIICIFDESNLIQASELKNIFDGSNICSVKINYFINYKTNNFIMLFLILDINNI